MPVREIPSGPPEAFLGAAEAVRAVIAQGTGLRPEIALEEVPAPPRIAPYSLALAADVSAPDPGGEGEELASGRFVLLHDPSAPEAWEGTFRIVTFARASLESEFGADPMLGQVGWSWLQDALETVEADHGEDGESGGHHALGGTVTRVLSESFGDLAGPPGTVEIEIRASWTPAGRVDVQLQGWAMLLGMIAGLPPLPPGVTALPRLR